MFMDDKPLSAEEKERLKGNASYPLIIALEGNTNKVS